MKCLLNVIFLCVGLSGFAQVETLDVCDVKVDGFCFWVNKDSVVANFGKPNKEYRPKYECGFLSEAEQGVIYYTIEYPHFYMTGNEKENYVFDQITLGPGLSSEIAIKGIRVSHNTTIADLERILGVKSNQFGILLYFKNADDGILFSFENGLLKKINYYSPC